MTSKGTKLSREEFKQKQDVEAARKAGTVPAELDALTGKEINPHIPQYISQAPWYLDQGVPTLVHQRPQKEDEAQEAAKDWYLRGAKAATAATKFRKGACENCGAMTHKTKDCLERPRKLNAKASGRDIKADEVIQTFELGFDGKRDRYNGYDANNYIDLIHEWEKVEEKRKAIRAKEIEIDLSANPDANKDDEDKYADNADMAGQKFDLKTRTTIRHLRIREDTAKYLRNLDTNSAHYDPKTRSMRDNPNPNRDPSELDFAGDNFVRYSGESKKMIDLQSFCWDANDKGVDLSLQANPTQAELMRKTFSTKKVEQKEQGKQSILERYGGEEHLEALPKELIFAQSERYVEYSRTGQVIKGQELRLAKSRYEEDVYPNNHTSVFGSYWEEGRWGYLCCHQFIKNSYCTGKAGIEAKKLNEALLLSQSERPQPPRPDESQLQRERERGREKEKEKEKEEREREKERERERDKEKEKEKESRKKSKEGKNKKRKENSSSSSESSEDEAPASKKAKYNSLQSHEFSEQDLQKYLRGKQHFDDPMKNYVDED